MPRCRNRCTQFVTLCDLLLYDNFRAALARALRMPIRKFARDRNFSENYERSELASLLSAREPAKIHLASLSYSQFYRRSLSLLKRAAVLAFTFIHPRARHFHHYTDERREWIFAPGRHGGRYLASEYSRISLPKALSTDRPTG